MMTHETSLDMNLSVSLDDESYFWRQDGGGQQDQGNEEKMTSQQVVENNYEGVPFDSSKEECVFNDVANTSTAPQGDDFTPTPQHEIDTELQEKLASSLAAHAQLTERVESLVKEHASIKDELTSRLDQAREQLSQRQIHASTEKKEYTKQVSQLTHVNQMLEREMSALKGRIEVVDQKAVDAASQADLQVDQTRLIQAQLSKENERLGRELDEARQARDRGAAEVLGLKQLLDEQIAGADASNNTATKRIKKGLEAAKFANHALANALAISERDLSEALHQKEKSLRECNSLRERIVELEDKSSWLSSKVNEMTKELQSSQKYIDTLYADLQSNRSPSKEIKAELERRELQWLELEHQYTRRIQELERQNASQSGGSKVSMDDYVAAVRECRRHQSEAVQKQQVVDELASTISSLKQQIEAMRRRPSPRNGVSTSTTSRGKSIATIRNYGKKVHNHSSVGKENDENKAPASSSEQREGAISGEMGGKTIRRISALKAVGGRKGLSEQLRRARRVGGEE
jgi:predicted  nucleic acid-binding Zn-ribbon protein